MPRYSVDPDFYSQALARLTPRTSSADVINQMALSPAFSRSATGSQGSPAESRSTESVNTAALGGNAGGFEQFVNSIAKQESGGRYGAVNKSSGALGKYQIMPMNIASWSKAALGKSVSKSQFLKSPQLQEAIARYKLKNYYSKYGAAGAAQAWYGGEGSLKRSQSAKNRTQAGGYPSLNQYSSAIVRRMGR